MISPKLFLDVYLFLAGSFAGMKTKQCFIWRVTREIRHVTSYALFIQFTVYHILQRERANFS